MSPSPFVLKAANQVRQEALGNEIESKKATKQDKIKPLFAPTCSCKTATQLVAGSSRAAGRGPIRLDTELQPKGRDPEDQAQ